MRKRKSNRETARDKPTPANLPADGIRSSANPVLDLQRTAGNRAVNEFLLGPSHRVSEPGEPEEIHAERVSQEVTGESHAESQHPQARTAEAPDTGGSATVESAGNLGTGRKMDPAVRAGMEKTFGHDFGEVRIHDDSRAAESANSVNARAYTMGKDVVFASGEYAPSKKEGKQLLAHELAHVVQQGAARPISPAAKAIAKSAPQPPSRKVLQRQPAPPGKQPAATPSAGSAGPAAAPPTTAPRLTQAFYDQAIAILSKLPGANATLIAILKQGKVGQKVSGVKVISSGPQADPNASPTKITFDLEISPTAAALPQGAAAQFVEDPAHQTDARSDPAKGIVVTRLLKIIAKPAASANDMAWSLLHEGIHMLLGMDRTVELVAGASPGVASGATGTLKSFVQYQRAGKKSSKRAPLVSALVTEVNRVKALSAPPPSGAPPGPKPPAGSPPSTGKPAAGAGANDVVETVIDEILEERFAFDQQLKQFPASRTAANSVLAGAYMFDEMAKELGLKSWPTPPNKQALVNLMIVFLDDVELILTPPAPPAPSGKPSPPPPPKTP